MDDGGEFHGRYILITAVITGSLMTGQISGIIWNGRRF